MILLRRLLLILTILILDRLIDGQLYAGWILTLLLMSRAHPCNVLNKTLHKVGVSFKGSTTLVCNLNVGLLVIL